MAGCCAWVVVEEVLTLHRREFLLQIFRPPEPKTHYGGGRVYGVTPLPHAAPGVYRLPNKPRPETLCVYLNGVRQKHGLDYSVSGDTLTFALVYRDLAPEEQVIMCDYEY